MEMRQRLIDHQMRSGLTWTRISDESGIPNGTLSLWKAGSYTGRNEDLTSKVRRYLEGREAVVQMSSRVGEDPGWLPTPTSRRILTLLRMAHTGKMTAFAGVPGCGKSVTALEYQSTAPNVFIVTLDDTLSSVSQMLRATLLTLGDDAPRYGAAPADLSRRIMSRLTGRRALLVFDEAQYLTQEALQVARRWCDLSDLGVAFLGDTELVKLLRASRKKSLATFNSRIAMQDYRPAVESADVDLVAAGWGVSDPAAVRFLRQIALNAGTLREVANTIGSANLLASEEERPLELDDIKAAWAQRNVDFATVR